MIKNILILAALTLSLVPCASAQVDRTREKNFAVPAGIGEGGSDTSAQWSLPAASFRDGTTTAVNPADGKVVIRAVCATTTNTAGGYVQIIDTDRIDHATIGNTVGSALVSITAKIIGANMDTMKQSCEYFPRGLPTTYGLVWLTSHANVRASVIYDKIRE